MKNRAGKLLISICLLLGLSACAVGPSKQVKSDIRSFAHNMRVVTDAFAEQMKATEAAHQAALKENTFLQFDLGGNPPVNEASLFSFQEYAVRNSLIETLQAYAHNLEEVFLDAEGDTVSLVSAELKEFDAELLELSHGLGAQQKTALIGSLEGLSKIAFASFANTEVGNIVQKNHPLVERAALLLYLDLGSPEHTDENCPTEDAFQSVKLSKNQIPLCRGGLRSIHSRANAEQLKTLRQRLQLLPKIKHSDEDREEVIDRLYKARKAGKTLDKSMAQTQQALIRLITAHRHLRAQYATTTETIGEDILPNWFGAEDKNGSVFKKLTELTNFLPDLVKEGRKLMEN
ncbi:hypothetical protein GUA87_05420 [Sneathiella sp. P13V-1]|uniref:hypothetical protein n=1 Tax=Sneathiella sp. P13V-1 TaxID=2697366 RepID=UPI00187B300E|nr:hypothetical protein [Sneathiella sp. P13V-1]MBE7636274.1 hypothetical protein [Sneathiella sp. P13V-1]